MPPRILVTPRSLTQAGVASVPELRPLTERGWELVTGPIGRVPAEQELLDLVESVEGWLAGVETIGATVLAAAPRLRVIARNGAGADAIDRAAAAVEGVEVRLAAGANARGVAELALGQILATLRDVPAASAALHDGRWQRMIGRELPDVTVGVVGFGAIGRLLAGFLTVLGAEVLATDPVAVVPASSGVHQVGLPELFERSDVVSLHSPPPSDGRPLVDAELLGRLPLGAVLVNTARSALVDGAAVLAALTTGHLSWYAVDAFDSEPPEPSPLLAHPRALLTPHLGGYTTGSVARATEQAVAAIIDVLDGRS